MCDIKVLYIYHDRAYYPHSTPHQSVHIKKKREMMAAWRDEQMHSKSKKMLKMVRIDVTFE